MLQDLWVTKPPTRTLYPLSHKVSWVLMQILDLRHLMRVNHKGSFVRRMLLYHWSAKCFELRVKKYTIMTNLTPPGGWNCSIYKTDHHLHRHTGARSQSVTKKLMSRCHSVIFAFTRLLRKSRDAPAGQGYDWDRAGLAAMSAHVSTFTAAGRLRFVTLVSSHSRPETSHKRQILNSKVWVRWKH